MELFEICNEIYVSGEWLQEFMELIIVPLDKRRG